MHTCRESVRNRSSGVLEHSLDLPFDELLGTRGPTLGVIDDGGIPRKRFRTDGKSSGQRSNAAR